MENIIKIFDEAEQNKERFCNVNYARSLASILKIAKEHGFKYSCGNIDPNNIVSGTNPCFVHEGLKETAILVAWTLMELTSELERTERQINEETRLDKLIGEAEDELKELQRKEISVSSILDELIAKRERVRTQS